MKAVILEVQGNSAAALSNGRIMKVQNYHYEIGQVIEMTAPKKISKKVIAYAASAAAIVAITTISALAYYTPYSYVSLDVNPSIEYSVNRFDRVLSANGVNDDGKKILKNLSLKNKAIETAVKDTVQEIVNDGYIPDKETGGIVIATSSDNEEKSDKMAEKLKTQAETIIADKRLEADVEAEGVGKDRVQEAKALGVTPGKLNLVQKLQASTSDTTINVEEWLKKPVKDIMKAIKENKKASKNPQENGNDAVTTTTNSASAASTNSNVYGTSTEKPSENNLSAKSNISKNNGNDNKTDSTASDQFKANEHEQSTNANHPNNGNAGDKSNKK